MLLIAAVMASELNLFKLVDFHSWLHSALLVFISAERMGQRKSRINPQGSRHDSIADDGDEDEDDEESQEILHFHRGKGEKTFLLNLLFFVFFYYFLQYRR